MRKQASYKKSTSKSITISRATFDQIKDFPLFFFNCEEKKEWNSEFGVNETINYWIPEAVYLSHYNHPFRCTDFKSSTGKILFTYGRLDPQTLSKTEEEITLFLEEFNPLNYDHIKAVLMLYATKALNQSDRFAFRELLWILNKYNLNLEAIDTFLDSFTDKSFKSFFLTQLTVISKCLSSQKQSKINEYLKSKDVSSELYFPEELKAALSKCYPNINFNKEDVNIFNLIYYAVISEKYRTTPNDYNYATEDIPDNFFLQLRKWIKDENYTFLQLDRLSDFFPLFYPSIQLRLLKRYFHAVRNNQISFDQAFIRNILNNKFELWGRYFHCAIEPCKPIRLTVPLLCDNILTFLNSGQKALQTLNGVLDMAYALCDTNSPKIDFGLKDIIPVCKGGATPDLAHFPGFISYKIVYHIDEANLTYDYIFNTFRRYLSTWGNQKMEFICGSKKTDSNNCQMRQSNFNICETCKEHIVKRFDIWDVKIKDNEADKLSILSLFTKIKCDLLSESQITIDAGNEFIGESEFKEELRKWLDHNFLKINDHKTLLKKDVSKSCNTLSNEKTILKAGWSVDPLRSNSDAYISFIIKDFLIPAWCIITPRKDFYIGRGVLDEQTHLNTSDIRKRNNLEEIQQLIGKEHGIILPHIESILNDYIPAHPNQDGEYVIPYDEELIRQLKSEFYTFKEHPNSDKIDKNTPGFMTIIRSKYDRYCAPKYENGINSVTNLPFFSCRGKECFRNSLSEQTLDECKTWEQFSILHIFEALGYPQITKTKGGNEPTELIRDFIGMVNKADALFRRVRCRECNHILFPISNSQFNRYNNFECRMPNCGEKWKRVYLSQCHSCKSGLIDSRDSARCPNGWTICPQCLSCCDDQLYEKMASKYLIRHLIIPQGLKNKLGKGHNNKEEFFCPKCGEKLEFRRDEHSDKSGKLCPSCHEWYNSFY